MAGHLKGSEHRPSRRSPKGAVGTSLTVHQAIRLIQTDNAVATGITVAGVAAAADAAANNGGGGYYSPQVYGVAWDQLYGKNYSVIWRCRDRLQGGSSTTTTATACRWSTAHGRVGRRRIDCGPIALRSRADQWRKHCEKSCGANAYSLIRDAFDA